MQIIHQDDAFKHEKCSFWDNIWVFLTLFSLICRLLAYWFFLDWTFTCAVLRATFGKKSQRFVVPPSYWYLFDSVPPTANIQGTGVPCQHKKWWRSCPPQAPCSLMKIERQHVSLAFLQHETLFTNLLDSLTVSFRTQVSLPVSVIHRCTIKRL